MRSELTAPCTPARVARALSRSIRPITARSPRSADARARGRAQGTRLRAACAAHAADRRCPALARRVDALHEHERRQRRRARARHTRVGVRKHGANGRVASLGRRRTRPSAAEAPVPTMCAACSDLRRRVPGRGECPDSESGGGGHVGTGAPSRISRRLPSRAHRLAAPVDAAPARLASVLAITSCVVWRSGVRMQARGLTLQRGDDTIGDRRRSGSHRQSRAPARACRVLSATAEAPQRAAQHRWRLHSGAAPTVTRASSARWRGDA